MLSSNTQKHVSMLAVIVGSLAAGMQIMLGNVGFTLIMAIIVAMNVFTTFYHARKEAELED